MEEVQNSASCKVSVLEETAIIITITSLVLQTGGLGLEVGKDNLACPRPTGKMLQSDSRAVPLTSYHPVCGGGA